MFENKVPTEPMNDQNQNSEVTRRDLLRGAIAATSLGVLGKSSGKGLVGDTNQHSITDVSGIKVGHFTDSRRPTGCTVIITEDGATAGVDVRGSAPGTRDTDLLNPINTVQMVHAVMLSGG